MTPRVRITGEFTSRTVRMNGRVLSPTRSQRVWNHSPDGFAWGYSGSGPAQLALAILLRAGLSDADAVRQHQRFKATVIAGLPQADFAIDVDLRPWLGSDDQ